MLLILIILAVFCLVGGLGTSYGGWGGGSYRSYGHGGAGLGLILFIVILFLLFSGGV